MSPRGSPPRIAPWWMSSGGQFMGTVRTTLLMPSSEACFQNDVPPRVESDLGPLDGEEAPLEDRRHDLDAHARIRQVGLEVALEEVVDVVLARIHAGGEAGPGHGRFRGLRRLQLRERALLGQPLEVRELAFVHPLAGQRRVHAVEAEHEHALLGAPHGLAGERTGPQCGQRDGAHRDGAGEVSREASGDSKRRPRGRR